MYQRGGRRSKIRRERKGWGGEDYNDDLGRTAK